MGSYGFLKYRSSYISLLCLLYFSNLIVASKQCNFPAIFNFGDSNSDTGGLASSAFDIPLPPYGETFFHMPADRFSDGRLMIDFIAKGLGLPYLSAYLNSLGSNFTNGANFATASSTIVPLRNVYPLGSFSPFSLNIQYKQFVRFKSRSQFLKKRGGIFSKLLPKKKYFSKALYTFDIGQNDLGAGFFGNLSIQEVIANVPNMVNNFSTVVENLYNQGGRSFWIHNTGPIGCLPYILVGFPVTVSQMDKVGCAVPYNDVAKYFNKRLKKAVIQLRKDLPLAAITYVDIYSAKYTLISRATKYGFEHPLVTCCGYGANKYNYSGTIQCGLTIDVNGTQVFVGSCDKPSVRVNWDGVHYTEAANKWIYDHIVDGSFSDPPISLRMACDG